MSTAAVRRMAPVLGVMLTVGMASLALAPKVMWGYDSWIMYQVAHNILTNGSFQTYDDGFGINSPYSSYGIGMSLLMVIPDAIASATGLDPMRLLVFINPLLLSLIAVVLWLMSRRAGLTTRQSTVTVLAVCLATLLLPYAATTFSEVLTALGIALCLLGVQICRDNPVWGGLLSGAGVLVAILARPDSLVLVAPVVVVAVFCAARSGQRLKALSTLAVGAGLAVVLTGWYNYVRFGSPLVSQYQGRSLGDSFSQPFMTGFLGLTVSPGRGMLLFVPLVIIMAVAFKWTFVRSPVLAVACVALLVDRVLFYASWWSWHGGVSWGPRFLVPAMPALAPFVIEVVRRLAAKPLLVRAAFAALIGASLAVQVVGASTHPGAGSVMEVVHAGEARAPWDRTTSGFLDWANSANSRAAWNEAMFDWRASPIVDGVRMLWKQQNVTSDFLVGGLRPKRQTFALLVIAIGLWLGLYRPSARKTGAG